MTPPGPPGSPPGGSGPKTAEPTLGGQIVRNSAFSLLGRFATVAGWMLLAPFMLERLGPDRFGLWSLLTVISGLYLTFDLGLASVITRFVAEYRASHDHRAGRSVFTTGAVTYAALALVFVVAVWLAREPLLDAFHVPVELRAEARGAILAAVIAYGVLQAYMLMASVLSGLHRMDVWNQVSVVVTLVQLGGAAVVLSMGGGLVALMVTTGAALAVGAVLSAAAVRRIAPEIGIDRGRPDLGLLRRMLAYGSALQLINLGVLVQFQLEKILFGSMLSLRAVGEYELGHRVVSALWAVPAVLLPPLLPAVAHLDATGDRERATRLYRRASRYVLAVAMPIASALVALAPLLYVAWLGPGHHDAALAAAALAAMLGVNILSGVGTAVARGIGRPGLEVRYHGIAMALHVVLSLVLIPRFGFMGGLWSLVLSTSVGTLYFFVRFHRFIGEPVGPFVRDIVAVPLLTAVAAGAVVAVATGAWSPATAELARDQALVRLALGAGAFGAVVLAAMLASGFLRTAEIRDLALMVSGRATREPAS